MSQTSGQISSLRRKVMISARSAKKVDALNAKDLDIIHMNVLIISQNNRRV
jgi:hypothetical protein